MTWIVGNLVSAADGGDRRQPGLRGRWRGSSATWSPRPMAGIVANRQRGARPNWPQARLGRCNFGIVNCLFSRKHHGTETLTVRPMPRPVFRKTHVHHHHGTETLTVRPMQQTPRESNQEPNRNGHLRVVTNSTRLLDRWCQQPDRHVSVATAMWPATRPNRRRQRHGDVVALLASATSPGVRSRLAR
jgi:hypothetical protein